VYKIQDYHNDLLITLFGFYVFTC